MKKLRMAARILLAGIWLWSSVAKLSDPAAFRPSVDAFHLVPVSWSPWMALYFPWLELALAITLLTRWHRGAVLLTALLMVVFTTALGLAWHRGLDLSCGCFGNTSDKTSFPLAIGRNLALLFISVPLLLQRDSDARPDQP